MSVPHIILSSWHILAVCQKLSNLMEIWWSSDKNKLGHFLAQPVFYLCHVSHCKIQQQSSFFNMPTTAKSTQNWEKKQCLLSTKCFLGTKIKFLQIFHQNCTLQHFYIEEIFPMSQITSTSSLDKLQARNCTLSSYISQILLLYK